MPARRVLTLVLLVGLVLPVGAATAQDPLADARQALEEARAEVDAARAEVAAAQLDANESAERLFASLDDQEGIEADIAALRERIVVTRGRLDSLADEVRELLVDQYVDGQRGARVLDGDDLNRSARAQAMSLFVVGTRVDSLDEWRLVRIELTELETALDTRLARQIDLVAELEGARASADERLADLTRERERLDDLVAELEAEEARLVAAEEARRRAEEEERRRIEEAARREAEAEEQALSQPTPVPTTAPETDAAPTPSPTEAPVVPDGAPPSSTTGWVCPVGGPTSFIDSWGAPRASGRWHKGTDMMAETGIPVVAVVDGTVEHRGNSVGGLSAHLTAGDGTYFYYTHLSGYANEGAGFVSQGTVIGHVGMTGNATVPHLHFEHHPGGRGNPVNPYPTLISSC